MSTLNSPLYGGPEAEMLCHSGDWCMRLHRTRKAEMTNVPHNGGFSCERDEDDCWVINDGEWENFSI